MLNLIMISLKKNLEKIFKEIQVDFPYYLPTNVNLDGDKPSFELNGFKYEFFGADLKNSNIGVSVADTGFMSTTYNKILDKSLEDDGIRKIVIDDIVKKLNFHTVFKQRLIMMDTAMVLYKKIKNKYPDKCILPSMVKDNDSKIRIKYDDNAIFTISFRTKHYFSKSNKNSLLYNNIQSVRYRKISNIVIRIDSTEIDLKLDNFKSFYNNIDYIFDTVIEPLSDDRMYFMDQKNNFKKITNKVKKEIESSNFVRKMKINSILND